MATSRVSKAEAVNLISVLLTLLACGCAPSVDSTRASSLANFRYARVDGEPLERFCASRSALLCCGPIEYGLVGPNQLYVHLEPQTGYGLATAINTDGYMVTASHLTKSAKLTLLFHAGGEFWAATPRIVVRDDQADFALLKIDHALDAAMPWAAEQEFCPGQPVIGVGSGVADHPPRAIVCIAGHVQGVDSSSDALGHWQFVVDDLPARPGDSGGAVFTPGGELVGLTSRGEAAAHRCWAVRPDPAWVAAVIARDKAAATTGPSSVHQITNDK